MSASNTRSVVIAFFALTIGFIAGIISLKAHDHRMGRRNSLGRQFMESSALMSDISDLDSNKKQELNKKFNIRLDSATLVIYLYVDNPELGSDARKMLNSIYKFRLKYPIDCQDKEIKTRLETALSVGEKYDNQSGINLSGKSKFGQ